MFQVDRAENRLKKLEEKRFADLQLRERGHLQEWLANMPAALGEELLIIQKEFDGFDDTRERLDLLALDKDGQLVVIENKLDDTGRDVVWQALKYAAYISSLTRAQIVDIFQAYLDRWCGGGNAVELICDFLDEEALDEVVLNSGNSQRVVLIAANFGAPLDWQRHDDRKASKIGHAQTFDCYPSENWPEITARMIEHIRRFEAAFRAPLQRLAPEMRAARIGAV